MYVITGATGNTGRVIAEALLKQKKPVRVVARRADALRALGSLGAQVAAGDLTNKDFLAQAFAGATAVYSMIPPNPIAPKMRVYQGQVGEATVWALRATHVKYVVNLSSLGADLPEGTGPVTGLYDQEQRLKQLESAHIVSLRPTYFMENLLGNISLIKEKGINGTAMTPDKAFPLIATRDIAAVVIDLLGGLSFEGHSVRELLGPEDVSMAQVTARIGKAIGKAELKYVQFPYDDTERALVGMGLSEDVAHGYVELSRAVNEGTGIRAKKRTPETTTPTRLETFLADTFVPAYRAATPG